jgi:hypothetical protein
MISHVHQVRHQGRHLTDLSRLVQLRGVLVLDMFRDTVAGAKKTKDAKLYGTHR